MRLYRIAKREMDQDVFEEITRDKWISVESSFINAIAYYEPLGMLEVRLKDGDEYSFAGVPKRVFNGFLKADSKGQYFNRVIKKYTGKKK